MKKQLLYPLILTFIPICTVAQTNVFPATGNVGIGTISPAAKLHLLQAAENYDSGIKIVGSTSPISGRLWMAGESFHIDNATAGSGSGFTLTKNGSIGLGTTNPQSYQNYQVLDITGNSATNGGYIRLATSNATGEARIFVSNDRLLFDVQQPNMYFQWRDADGNQIHSLRQDGSAIWNGDDQSYTEITSSVNGPFIRQYSNDGEFSWIIRGYAYDSVQADFRQGGINVNGTVRSKEVKVTVDGWSDHVFEKNYKLIPLHELEAYIRTHRHLPGIPTEVQVKKEGVNLGEMNAKLLEKIEELTLYLLQQSKMLKQQQQLINEQQKQITEIMSRHAK